MTSPFEARLEVLATPEALARRAADWLPGAALAKNGTFAHAAFLVAGKEKQPVLARLRSGGASLPETHLNTAGTLHLLAGAAAV